MDARFKCCKRKCGWIGTKVEMRRVQDPEHAGFEIYTFTCPKCGGDDFYELKEREAKKQAK